jgi:hypothetical protein
MKLIEKFLLGAALLSSTSVLAQDQAVSGFAFQPPSIAVGETGTFKTDIINNSGSPFPSTTTVSWSFSIPPIIEVTSFVFDNNNANNYVDVVISTYNSVSGQDIYVTSKPNVAYPGGLAGAYEMTFSIIGKSAGSGNLAASTTASPANGFNMSGNDNVFSPFGVTSPLPITWLNFDAKAEKNATTISWATAQEKNNKGFNVQRSKDSKSWGNIAYVNTKTSQGNSSEKLDYTAVDKTPFTGINYYRIEQMDLDGTQSYSVVKAVVFGAKSNITLFPNPATETLHIAGLNGKNTIVVINALGQMVKTVETENSTEVLNVETIPNGMYQLRILQNETIIHNTKFAKTK